MSERLLLPPARAGGLSGETPTLYLRVVLAAVGVTVILYGAADVISRVGHATFGQNTNKIAFGPAIVALDQALSTPLAPLTNPIIPARLVVPAIGIDAAVERVGKKPDGSMATPSTFGDVGWYSFGSRPGEPGSAVIAGHVNNALTKAGVFEHLSDLAIGDDVIVRDASGRVLHFAVRDIEDYSSDQAPVETIFSNSGPSELVLVTCIGDWDPKARSYDHRLVVYAGLLAGQ